MKTPAGWRWRQVLRRLAIAVVVLLAAGWIALVAINKPRPQGVPAPEAELVAKSMLLAVNASAWQRTGAVMFTFIGHRHLWDRKRNYDRVEWGDHRVLLRIGSRTARAWEDGVEVHGKRADKLAHDAYAAWVNDSYWLNPVVKIFDRGVTRSIIRDSLGGTRLLVEYSSGGLTPDDAYLWTPGANDDPPTEWRMWVHVLPIGGLSVTWERWVSLSTGAKISTLHHIGPVTLELKDVAGATTLSELLGSADDPFTPLVASK